MSNEISPIDITRFPELVRLAEEVQHSRRDLLLKHGEQALAVLTPVPSEDTMPRRAPHSSSASERDSILNIIGIGESAEPTDIAHHEQQYLAEAYEPMPQCDLPQNTAIECLWTPRRTSPV